MRTIPGETFSSHRSNSILKQSRVHAVWSSRLARKASHDRPSSVYTFCSDAVALLSRMSRPFISDSRLGLRSRKHGQEVESWNMVRILKTSLNRSSPLLNMLSKKKKWLERSDFASLITISIGQFAICLIKLQSQSSTGTNTLWIMGKKWKGHDLNMFNCLPRLKCSSWGWELDLQSSAIIIN